MAATNHLANLVADRIPGAVRGFGFASGALKNSILASPFVRKVGAIVEGIVGSPLLYAPVIEDGRRPGAPISQTGVTNIGLWAVRKLGEKLVKNGDSFAQEINLYQIGFPIAAAIKARGFKAPYQNGLRMFQRAAEAGQAQVEALLREAVEAYTASFGGAVGAA